VHALCAAGMWHCCRVDVIPIDNVCAVPGSAASCAMHRVLAIRALADEIAVEPAIGGGPANGRANQRDERKT